MTEFVDNGEYKNDQTEKDLERIRDERNFLFEVACPVRLTEFEESVDRLLESAPAEYNFAYQLETESGSGIAFEVSKFKDEPLASHSTVSLSTKSQPGDVVRYYFKSDGQFSDEHSIRYCNNDLLEGVLEDLKDDNQLNAQENMIINYIQEQSNHSYYPVSLIRPWGQPGRDNPKVSTVIEHLVRDNVRYFTRLKQLRINVDHQLSLSLNEKEIISNSPDFKPNSKLLPQVTLIVEDSECEKLYNYIKRGTSEPIVCVHPFDGPPEHHSPKVSWPAGSPEETTEGQVQAFVRSMNERLRLPHKEDIQFMANCLGIVRAKILDFASITEE